MSPRMESIVPLLESFRAVRFYPSNGVALADRDRSGRDQAAAGHGGFPWVPISRDLQDVRKHILYPN